MNKMKLLESLDSGSNYNFGEKMNQPKNPKSLFDLSHLSTMTIPNAGYVIPITQFEALPGDDHDINVDCLLRVLPQVVPLYSRQRLYVYAFYSRYSDLWNNWQPFMDKGYTGNVEYLIPSLKTNTNFSMGDNTDTSIPADSLLNYMGLPIGATYSSLFNGDNSAHISALPQMALLRIYRDYFMNKNEFINDRVMLPDDDSRFRLDNDGKLLSAKDQNKNFYFSNRPSYDLEISGNNYYFSGFYHEYPDDYFISALPFTQRGTAPKLDFNIDPTALGIDFSNVFGVTGGTTIRYLGVAPSSIGDTNKIAAFDDHNSSYYANPESNYTNSAKTAFNKAKITGSSLPASITLEEIRELALAQTEMEILARTDGSYAQFGLSFFGEVSKAAHDYRSTYIGGVYKNIAFTEVLQTSESTNGNPLGNYGGHGITGMSNSRLGHIHCDDYGIITILACIMPDIYYSQGLSRLFTDRVQAEKYLPLRSKLGLQPIYNKELYYAGNNGNEEGEDNYLWAYQNPFDHLRYIPSRICGKIADPNNNSFIPYTQSRIFTQLPNWGRSFSEANDVRKDYLAGNTAEDAYTAQFKINIRSVREMPYKSVPAQII